jgi:hypothetical protein
LTENFDDGGAAEGVLLVEVDPQFGAGRAQVGGTGSGAGPAGRWRPSGSERASWMVICGIPSSRGG